jgi:hypothetical protein
MCFGTVVVFGVVPQEQLLKSVAPFTDAARIMWGAWGAGAIAFAVIISAIGALNGWTLMMGQVPWPPHRTAYFRRCSENCPGAAFRPWHRDLGVVRDRHGGVRGWGARACAPSTTS